jgi:hypothetical protein
MFSRYSPISLLIFSNPLESVKKVKLNRKRYPHTKKLPFALLNAEITNAKIKVYGLVSLWIDL